ncbi:MAG: tonB-system energizer ExbB [Pseudomonadota bacterium]
MTPIKKAAGFLVLLAAATTLLIAQTVAQAPNAQAPAAQAPSAQVPAAQTPNVQAPSVQAPSAPAPVAQIKNPALPHNLSPWGMFMGADIVVKAVMIGLAFASLITWTICVAKLLELRSETRRARRRVAVLGRDVSLADAEHDARGGSDAVAQLIHSAANEAKLSDTVNDEGFKDRVELRLSRVEAAMSRKIARGTGVLATIGATAPFVGLFGTVWGIMNSFIGISEAHTTNLAVVAPGIAEALLATAMGLIAAIPAVVIYNHLVRMITAYRAMLGDASAQVMLLISRDQGRRSMRMSRAAE